MAKSGFNPQAYLGKEISKVEELENGYVRLHFTDGSAIIAQLVPVALTIVSDAATPKKGKEAKPVQEEEEEEEDGDEEEVSIEDMKEALLEAEAFTKKELKKMSDEDIEEAYNELEPEDEDEGEEDEDEVSIDDMRAALIEAGEAKKKVSKMSDEEVEEAYGELEEEEEEESDEDEDEDEDDKLSAADILEMDFDDLEDTIDDNELDIDIEDYDSDDKKSVEKLRKAVAKALNIKL